MSTNPDPSSSQSTTNKRGRPISNRYPCHLFPTEHQSWRNAMYRIAHHPNYKHLSFQKEWLSFDTFMDDLGPKPNDGQRYTIDRIDSSIGYVRGNVRWATYATQNRNRPSFCHYYLTPHGVLCLAEIARAFGLRPGSVEAKHRRGTLAATLNITPLSRTHAASHAHQQHAASQPD